jgi:calcineurin-like phosphoesterase family protein
MRNLSTDQEQQANAMAARIQAQVQTDPRARAQLAKLNLGGYLKASESKLNQAVRKERLSLDDREGSLEFGYALWQLNTLYPDMARQLELPQSSLDMAQLERMDATLEGPGEVAPDGTLLGFGKYKQLDPGWILAGLYYVGLMTHVFEPAPFKTNPVIVHPSSSIVTIAVVGDWGTGEWQDGASDCPALQVKQQIAALHPDYTIHLGDVYYAGTQFGLLQSPGEEMTNFVNLWQPGSAATAATFTLNSNHEMYDGANGYFGRALAAQHFAGQQQTSYFAIEGDTWVIIGLDSAYHATSPFVIEGALTDQDQINFIKQLDTTNKTVIVMTHHNGMIIEGTAQLPLWGQVAAALGGGRARPPDFWYWGHIHNGIVYSDQSAAGAATKARCVGHGGLPIGSASALQRNGRPIASVLFFANTPFPNPDPDQVNRVLNGFALLTISPDSITEQFFDQTGDIAWSQVSPLG